MRESIKNFTEWEGIMNCESREMSGGRYWGLLEL